MFDTWSMNYTPIWRVTHLAGAVSTSFMELLGSGDRSQDTTCCSEPFVECRA
jgi:hypothetical protein